MHFFSLHCLFSPHFCHEILFNLNKKPYKTLIGDAPKHIPAKGIINVTREETAYLASSFFLSFFIR